MTYKEVYKKICKSAAEHLYSLEVYDEFDECDHARVEKAIAEIQRQLKNKANK